MYLIKESINSNLPAIKVNGIYRVLGLKPSSPESLLKFPKFGAHAVLDPSQWQEIDLQHYNVPILDQGSTSSCVAHGCRSGMEYCYKQSGKPSNEFNQYFLYAFINGGRDAGASITDGMQSLIDNGICLKNDLPLRVLFHNQLTPESVNNGKRFKLIQAYHCTSFEEICSAITLGFTVPLGLWVDQNFARLDADGVAGVARSMQTGGGHLILGVGLKKSTKYGWLIKIQNSWAQSFGMGGFAYIHKGHLQLMSPDAFAIQSVSDDPLANDPSNIPPVLVGANMEETLKVENLKQNALDLGFDGGWIADILQKYGSDVLALLIEAVRNGISITLIVELINKFGPLVLQFLVDILNKRNSLRAAGEFVDGAIVAEESTVLDVIIQNFLQQILEKYLPMLVEKYGEQIVKFVIDLILKSLKVTT